MRRRWISGSARRHAVAVLAVAVTAVATMTALAAPAGATMYDHGRFSDTDHFTYDDCGFTVAVDGTYTGSFHDRVAKGDLTSAFYFHRRLVVVEKHTNPANGKYFTLRVKEIFNEIKAVRV